jgi:hypothetical protein
MENLKKQLEDKLMEIYPLTKKETYKGISTKDIIEGLNEMSRDIQNKTDRNILEDLPYTVPRKDAIEMSTKLYFHIAKRLANEIKSL